MNKSNENIAIAALDIGTSQIKLGVFYPLVSPRITILGSIKNELKYGTIGEVTSSYGATREASFSLFKKLGEFLQEHHPDKLFLGLCSHVSSLLEWDRDSGVPIKNDFPVWMDSTCNSALDKFAEILGHDKSKRMLGSFLPPGNNWLLSKLMAYTEKNRALFLQAGDAIFYELSGVFATHYSSQISIVHHERKEYVDELLSAVNIQKYQLPEIKAEFNPVLPEMIKTFGWSARSFVFPSMADFFSSFYGLRLNNNEGFVLASTSEIAGVYNEINVPASEHFVIFPFDNGSIQYGSTNTGANLISWFVNNMLGKEVSAGLLDDLTAEAEKINPADTPVFLPYIKGERAPFWDHRLKASFTGLRLHHSSAHMFRAVLEAVAFARRQCFEYLGTEAINIVKMGGGSTKNQLWNTIRANVLNKKIALADEQELAISGLINCMSDNLLMDASALNFSVIEPDEKFVRIYENKYKEFLHYQKVLLK